LEPGYEYNPSGGSLTIEIVNPVVLGSQSYTSTPVDPETRTLNTSYKPGASAGSFNIDPTGGASYRIPIEVQTGVNGLKPDLSLVYSSNSGPGIAGYGWDISGISRIDRGSLIYYFDSSSTSDTTDRFYLDGLRLVNTSYQYGNPSAQYQTDNDIFTRVTPQGSGTYGPSWFKAETKSGLIYEYGNTTGSKELASWSDMVLRWNVSKIKDLFDNQINFAYFKDQSVSYLGEITYGPNTITFYYKTRLDNLVSYQKGTKTEERLILDKITIKYNSSVVKTYELKYNYIYSWSNIYSQLNEVIEYGTGTERYNSTAFTYWSPKNISFSLTTNNTTHADITYKSRIIPGDFNGDGKTDFLCLPDASKGATWTGKRVYKSDGNDSFTLLFSDPNSITLTNLMDIRALDINGDGFDDILYELVSSGTSYFLYILNNNGTAFNSAVQITTTANGANSGFSGKTRRNELQEDDNEPFGDDYNGDGVNDILISNPAGSFFIYSFVNQSGVMTSTLNQLCSYALGVSNDIITSDFNGDGKSDIWQLTDNELFIRGLNYGNSVIHLKGLPNTLTRKHFFSLGDFNSDGKTDVLIYGSGKGGTEVDYQDWQILFSTGYGFDVSSLYQKRANLKDEYVRLGDFNDDRKTDIMVTSGDQSWTGTYYYIAKNNGDDFNTYNLSSEPSTSNNFYLGDYNGDGHSDYITTDKLSPWVNGYKVFRTLADTAFAMRKVANGLGQLTKITYTKLSQASSTVYQKGTGTTYPVSDFQGPMTIVSSIQVDNGKGSLNTHNYYYEGAKFQIQGKGFIGFAKTRDGDVIAGIENETISSYNTTYFYPQLLKTLSKRLGTTDTIERVSNTWSQVILDASKKRIFPYIQSSVKLNKLTGNKITVTTQCDSWGNPTSIVKSYLNGPTETTTHIYENLTTNWLLGRPTSTSIQYTGGGNTITRSGSRVFSSTSNNKTSETWYSGTNNQFIKGFKYNTNGTLKRDSITANGTYRTTIYSYETNGVRIKTVTDPLSHTITNTYNTYGRLATKAYYPGITLTYTYNELGRVTNISSNDGSQTTTTYAWETPTSTPKPARYSILQTGNDGSQTKSWFDKLSREIRTDVRGFDGSWIYTDTKYNIKGQVDSISEPYFSGPLWNRYLYDNYGRQTNLYKPSGRNSSWTYNNNTITETTGGRTFSKSYSSDGTVSSATDAGGTISYTYFPDGKVKTITAPGSVVTTMQYDLAGNQIQLVDPSAGTTNYTYDGFGQLLTHQNARLQTTSLTYNSNGTIYRKVTPEGNTKYRYNTNKLLSNINSPGGASRSFAYDSYGRVTSVIDTLPGLTSPSGTAYTYDSYGRLGTITHPSAIVETKNYNSNGYMSSVSAGGSARWTVTSMNARQQITAGRYGASLNAAFGYDSYGYLTSNTTGSLQNYTYSFDAVTGNLNWRKNVLQANIQENFEYDNLDRLDRVYRGSTTLLDMVYDSNKGGITTKSDAGTLNYNISAKPYALGTVNPSTGLLPTAIDSLTYTSFEKVNTISEGNYSVDFAYNPYNERARMEVKQSGNTILTRWYSGGSFIKETASGVTKDYTFIGGDTYSAPVVAITQSGTTTYYNLLRDHLGSITHVVNASNNTLLYEYSYDPWGRMRNVTTWTNYAPGSEPSLFIAGRGFTGHEHLPWFNLINMNGRIYDPLVGQFLSPDNQIQEPYFTQNFNRYVYCYNNPLKFTDPSGMGIEDLLYQSYYPIIQSSGYRSNPNYHYDYGNGRYYDAQGNQVPFWEVYNNQILSTSTKVSDVNKFNDYFSKGFTIYYYNLYGRDNLIASLGDPGLYLSGGGYRATNYTASVFPLQPTTAGQGGDYIWVKNTQIGMGGFNIGNSVKGGMIDYAIASSAGKSINSLKRADYVATLGKTGANYVRVFKVAGGVTFGASTLISAGLTYNYYSSGGTGSDVLVKSSIDVTMGIVGLFWPIGTGISATYFIIDAATGGFGGYGDPLKINK
jgi:RHS repeat-associated protein